MTGDRKEPGFGRPDVKLTLEGMTNYQLAVAHMVLTTEVRGKLPRRDGNPGSYTYDDREGMVPMIKFATDPEHEFVGQANRLNPDLPLLKYFVNLRGASERDYTSMAELLKHTDIPFDFDYVTGIPDTGSKIAKAYADLTGKPYYEILTKTADESGRQFSVKVFSSNEPRPGPDEKGLWIDDLIQRSVTKVLVDDISTQAGYHVAGHAVVLDREEGGMEEMHQAGKKIVAGITTTELVCVASDKGMIDDDVFEDVIGNINDGILRRSLSRGI